MVDSMRLLCVGTSLKHILGVLKTEIRNENMCYQSEDAENSLKLFSNDLKEMRELGYNSAEIVGELNTSLEYGFLQMWENGYVDD
jgi:hypothetical protein